ncbi:RHS repeat-associated core domain-containing protein [Trinickia sp. NRRL B-1857]|uniref:RHS repeat-associated core domain-containing protein n=1 Tax=Trinickia sp. NRRL B-1857 TaxID=3162879 RepID=UPI003D2C0B27
MNPSDLAGFTGVYRDCATFAIPLGNGYRWYLPWLMRFAAPDSWSPFGAGGIHPYAYCAADPINRSDRSGHMWSGLLKDVSETAGENTREAAGEAASSLAAQTSQRATQEATKSTPSTSGEASRSSDDSASGAAQRPRAARPTTLQLNPFVSPGTLTVRTPEPAEVNELIARHRGTAAEIEQKALAIRQQWPDVMQEYRRERAVLGRTDPHVAQETRPVVHDLAVNANHLLANLTQLDEQLGRRASQFERERAEIRGLQERIGNISAEAWSLHGILRRQIDFASTSVFDFDWDRNAN